MTVIKTSTLIRALIVSIWLVVTLFVLGLFGIHSGWSAFLVMLFFIEGGGKLEKLKSIFAGGGVGLITAYLLTQGVIILGPIMGTSSSLFLMVFIAIFLLIALGDVSHNLFNSYTFCYFTVALITKQQNTIMWLITMVLGGAFVVGGILMLTKLVKNLSKDKSKKQVKLGA